VFVEGDPMVKAPTAGRRHHRFPLKNVVEFTPWDPKNNVFGFATDISVGGAFVETAFPATPGTKILVRVWPPGWTSEMLLPGIVRWGSPAGMGVEFLSVGPREALGIHALVIEHKALARENADTKLTG
jgi:hypothetical protein